MNTHAAQAAHATTQATTRAATQAIGIFDSGVGGLSVLRAMLHELPQERLVYVSDNGHAPYGERDDAYVVNRSLAVARHLVAQHRIKALVVACNTATAAAIKHLRREYAHLPIVGIEPALKPAALHSRTQRIGVLATRSTLNSEKFRALQESLSTHGNIRFHLQACDGLAHAIEHNDTAQIAALCARYTQALGTFGNGPGDIDTLVLGCTHYPFAHETLVQLVGNQVAFLEGGTPVARQTRKLLAEAGQLAGAGAEAEAEAANINASATAALTLECTGDPQGLHLALQRWLHIAMPVQACSIA